MAKTGKQIGTQVRKCRKQKPATPEVLRGTTPTSNTSISNLRLYVLERDKYICQCCGFIDSSMEVHHIYPRRFGGFDDANNLITLCSFCHDGVPSNPDDFLNYQRQGGQHWRTLRYQLEKELQKEGEAELAPKYKKSLEEFLFKKRQDRFGRSLVQMQEDLARLGLDLEDKENIQLWLAEELPLPDPDVELWFRKPSPYLKSIASTFEEPCVVDPGIILTWLVIGYQYIGEPYSVWIEKKKLVDCRVEPIVRLL